jgi:hypothetical protein
MIDDPIVRHRNGRTNLLSRLLLQPPNVELRAELAIVAPLSSDASLAATHQSYKPFLDTLQDRSVVIRIFQFP